MKKKKVTVIVISILIILILLLAITYAFFSTQLSGTEGIVKVGELELVLNETSEGIKLDNAIGLSDSEGLSLGSSTFKLINNGSKAVDYIIYLDDNTIEDTDTRIDDKYLKYNLNKNGKNSGPTPLTIVGSNKNRVLDSGTIEGKGINEYSLNLWITSEVDGNYSGQVFSGKLRVEVSQEKDKSVATVVMNNIGEKGNLYDDGVDTFITGEEPNNYIWYSGKLWRAVSINNGEKTVKLVTQWNISSIPYSNKSGAFEESYMKMWLNDKTADGFLENLRSPEKFIKMDSKWNASQMSDNSKPPSENEGGTLVEAPVGLLNIYEYVMSYSGTTYSNGYLNNGLQWWTLTPVNLSNIHIVNTGGDIFNSIIQAAYGIRPSINLRSDVKIVSGDGTVDNPYRLEGDNDSNLSGTLLNARYSGEYIKLGIGENSLYRIVSHENEIGTKIVRNESLKENGKFKKLAFGDTTNYSSTNIIGNFVNSVYLDDYLTKDEIKMMEDNSIWYLGIVGYGGSYKLAKYTNTTDNILTSSTVNAKIGLLRLGELMSGQFERYNLKNSTIFSNLVTSYWTLTPYNLNLTLRRIEAASNGNTAFPASLSGVRPTMNLKSNVIITEGDGTLKKPFKIKLS